MNEKIAAASLVYLLALFASFMFGDISWRLSRNMGPVFEWLALGSAIGIGLLIGVGANWVIRKVLLLGVLGKGSDKWKR